MYLEPILSSGGGGDGAFPRLDRDWRQAARTLDADPRPAALLARLAAFSPLLDSLLQQLQRCQAALQQYIAVSIYLIIWFPETRTVFLVSFRNIRTLDLIYSKIKA